MRKSHQAILAAVLVPTVVPGMCAAPARAAVQVADNHVSVTGEAAGAWAPRINAEVRPDGHGLFTYDNPESVVDVLRFDVTSDVAIDGAAVPADWSAQPVANTHLGADTVTYTQSVGGVTVARTFRTDGDRVDVTVTVRNARDTAAKVQVDVANTVDDGAARAQVRDGSFVVSPAARGYETTVYFGAPQQAGTGPSAGEALAAGGVGAGAPTVQAARWAKTLQPGEALIARTGITSAAQPGALDSDGDGLRDVWEANGITLADGTSMPIHEWGAKQTRPDLFLQLNWMKSEWESLGCDRASRFSATVDGFEAFAKCAKANTKDYAPTPETLKELEDLFARHGVALHIDAGAGYVSSGMAAMRERQGGKTLDYQASYFDGEDAGTKLLRERDRLLGKRASVFRVGIIGDAMDAGNQASGVSVMNDSVFYVANHEGMTTQDQLRNSILHEFGHTLNLGHNGAHVPGNTAPATNDLDWYNSVMSYAHQFNHFDYSSKDESSSNYTIPADWANLNLPGNNVGKGAISVGTKGAENGTGGDAESGNGKTNAKPHEHPAEPDVETLVRNAADEHNGKAGFRMLATKNGDNGIVTQLDGDNVVRGEVRNLGSTPETYTVAVDYGTGTFRKQYRLAPAQYADAAHQVDIPIDRAAFIDSPVVPLHVTVTNSKGEQVVSDIFRLSALEYTPEEMQRVLRAVLASDKDQALKDFATRKLNPADPEQKVTRAKQAQPSTPATPQGSSASTLSIVIGVLLALVGAGTAWYGWAVDQGLVAAPF